MNLPKLVLLLALSACGGSPVSSLLVDPAPDAGDPPDAATFHADASGPSDPPDAPPPAPDAGEAKPDARVGAEPTALEAGLPVPVDAGVDAASCPAKACSGFAGACGAVELECAGSLSEYSCGACPTPGQGVGETACGDNGAVGQCGSTCSFNPSAADVCAWTGYPNAWAVLSDCGGTPWRWEGGGPVFRPAGRTGCVAATYDGAVPLSGITTAVCCP